MEIEIWYSRLQSGEILQDQAVVVEQQQTSIPATTARSSNTSLERKEPRPLVIQV